MPRFSLCLLALALAPAVAGQLSPPTFVYEYTPGPGGDLFQLTDGLSIRADPARVPIAFGPEAFPSVSILGQTNGWPSGTGQLMLPMFSVGHLGQTGAFWVGVGQTPAGQGPFLYQPATRAFRMTNFGPGAHTVHVAPLPNNRALATWLMPPNPLGSSVIDGPTGQVMPLAGEVSADAVELGNKLYGSVWSPSDGSEFCEDDLISGQRTTRTLVPGPGGASPTDFVVIDHGRVGFAANDANGDGELWVHQTTGQPSFVTININPSGSSDPRNLTATEHGRAILTAFTFGFGRELWETDGTVAGTTRVTDLNQGTGDGFDSNRRGPFTVVNGVAFFAATSQPTGTEVFFKVPRDPNVHLTVDYVSGPGGSNPQDIRGYGGSKVVWVANQDLVAYDYVSRTLQVLATGMDPARPEHIGVGDGVVISYFTPPTGHALFRAELGAVLVPHGEGSYANFKHVLGGTAPVVNRNLTLHGQTGTPGGVALAFLGIGAARIPFFLGNWLYLDPLTLVLLGVAPVNGHAWTLDTPIGNDPSLVGAEGTVQAFQITPTLDVSASNPAWLKLATR